MTDADESWSSRREEVNRLLAELHGCPDGSAQEKSLRDELTRLHLPLVRYLARRFEGRSVPLDDLVQVGAIGLIKAIDRFDTERGIEFVSYAAPTILGEIKRYFRDSGWLIHVPRRAQELQTAVDRARSELNQELRRAPTVAELSERVGVPPDQVVEALDVARGYAGVPLDALIDPETGGGQGVVAQVDEGMENVELRETLRPALQTLPEREREILMMRFAAGRTQTEIAEAIGVSQMQVSRLISRSLARLREHLTDASADGYGSSGVGEAEAG
ncbi:MAG: SigB/SigF/SigG family RNA polymerase sigma factor [Actinomycetota bacterium]|nr:SigB/SigF/SigG family RNA polymerase sigma factor [Actinomycetota bacterium]